MDRRTFLLSLPILPFSAYSMKLSSLHQFAQSLPSTPTMPVLFLGHGSPMNAIEDNEFVQGFKQIATEIPKPTAILCISAHWETVGTKVTSMPNPPTIHDFGGFPKALFEVQYPAPGSPLLAAETKALVTSISLDEAWGLDHGAWSVIKHLYPAADVPIVQLSLDYTQPASYHYELAQALQPLRQKGILIIGSGNMVHNLRRIAWDKFHVPDYAFDWATEANQTMKNWILEQNHTALVNFRSAGKAFDLAIPTPEHYLPLLYTLGLQQKEENITFFNDKAVGGSLTMTSVKIG